jgi:hypothetical protein
MFAICVSMCSLSPSLSVLFVDHEPTLFRCRPTLAHTLTLTLCLSTTLPFSLPFKRCCDTLIGINRNTDFSLSSSYHFKGRTYTKQGRLSLGGWNLTKLTFGKVHFNFCFINFCLKLIDHSSSSKWSPGPSRSGFFYWVAIQLWTFAPLRSIPVSNFTEIGTVV